MKNSGDDRDKDMIFQFVMRMVLEEAHVGWYD